MEQAARPRTPGIVYGGMSMAMLLLIAVLALTARQPPPPSVAEFAPQAVEQIKNAPNAQSSRFGNGDSGAGGGGEATATTLAGSGASTTTVPKTVDKARVRQCIGNPPRQIEDPQSPPCVAYYDGPKATALGPGITADEVRVAVPNDNGEISAEQRAWANFFNRRFEFYGRKVVLVPFKVSGDQTSVGMRADAEAVAQLNVFASLSYPDRHGIEHFYYDALADRKVVSVASRPTIDDEAHYAEHRPYEWNYFPAVDNIARELGSFTCNMLKGRPSKYAAATEQADQRVFGLIVEAPKENGPPPNMAQLRQAMAGCGAKPAVDLLLVDGADGNSSAMVKFQQARVTTVLCICHQSNLAFTYMPAATGQGYFPEWVITTFLYHDNDLGGKTYPQAQAAHTFGLKFRNKGLSPSDDPRCWALREGDPSQSCSVELDPYNLYKQLLLLSSGVQSAGVSLSARSFEAGLLGAAFPNPGARVEPYFQARVGFEQGRHTMMQDAAVIWWSASEQSYESGSSGAWCYADRGRRYDVFPNAEPVLFSGPCR
jgi:hypothetical protein